MSGNVRLMPSTVSIAFNFTWTCYVLTGAHDSRVDRMGT
eukprot:COSAG06_NODE_65424_length_257_cov_0.632911_1_plen_38_part_01